MYNIITLYTYYENIITQEGKCVLYGLRSSSRANILRIIKGYTKPKCALLKSSRFEQILYWS